MRSKVPLVPPQSCPLRFLLPASPYGGADLFSPFELICPLKSWTCLLGSSGVGKSTVLRLIAGLHPGVSPADIYRGDGTPVPGQIAYMAQQDLLLPWASVLENVVIGDTLRGQAADTNRALELLAAAGIAEQAPHRPHRLSGGQRQRVALVRTLYEDRPIVLMDEPFSALDPVTRLILQDLAADLLREKTVILVTHDPLEALRLGDQVIVLQGSPASPSPPLLPPGHRPRRVNDANILTLQEQLLQLLGHKSAEDAPG